MRELRRAGSLGAVLLLLATTLLLAGCGSGPEEYRVVVPAGTAERIAAGEDVQLIDTEIDLSVGDSIVIVNQDTELHQVGPFPVRAGETFDHTFSTPGTFEGVCSLHPDNAVVITVT